MMMINIAIIIMYYPNSRGFYTHKPRKRLSSRHRKPPVHIPSEYGAMPPTHVAEWESHTSVQAELLKHVITRSNVNLPEAKQEQLSLPSIMHSHRL